MAEFESWADRPEAAPGEKLAWEVAGELASESEKARLAFGQATLGLLGHRSSTADALNAALDADSNLSAALLLKGYGMKVLGRRDLNPAIEDILQQSDLIIRRRGGLRESRLLEALSIWLNGRADTAADHLEEAQRAAPDDLLLMKLIQAIRFMMGDTEGMLRSVERALKHLGNGTIAEGFARGCRAFALVESGLRNEAREEAEFALAINPGDAWALHALAHVLYENGNMEEGAELLSSSDSCIDGLNNFAGHIAWHEALFHLECGQPERALKLYDHRVAVYPPHDYRDVSNASTLLLLLEDHGIEVEDRWQYLATIARLRLGDHGLAFADIHYVLSLAGAGCVEEASHYVAGMRAAGMARKNDFDAEVLIDVGAPIAEALVTARSGNFAAASKCVRALSSELHRMGGSRAQRLVIPWVLRSAKNREARTLATRRGEE